VASEDGVAAEVAQKPENSLSQNYPVCVLIDLCRRLEDGLERADELGWVL